MACVPPDWMGAHGARFAYAKRLLLKSSSSSTPEEIAKLADVGFLLDAEIARVNHYPRLDPTLKRSLCVPPSENTRALLAAQQFDALLDQYPLTTSRGSGRTLLSDYLNAFVIFVLTKIAPGSGAEEELDEEVIDTKREGCRLDPTRATSVIHVSSDPQDRIIATDNNIEYSFVCLNVVDNVEKALVLLPSLDAMRGCQRNFIVFGQTPNSHVLVQPKDPTKAAYYTYQPPPGVQVSDVLSAFVSKAASFEKDDFRNVVLLHCTNDMISSVVAHTPTKKKGPFATILNFLVVNKNGVYFRSRGDTTVDRGPGLFRHMTLTMRNSNKVDSKVSYWFGLPHREYVDPNKTVRQQWWFQWAMDGAVACGFGRLRQSSGTCWFNAVLNCFLLSDRLGGLALARYRAWLRRLSVDDRAAFTRRAETFRVDVGALCPRMTVEAVREVLFTYVHTVLALRRPARPEQADFIEKGAAVLDRVYKLGAVPSSDKDARNYGQGSSPVTAMKLALEAIFALHEFAFLDESIDLKRLKQDEFQVAPNRLSPLSLRQAPPRVLAVSLGVGTRSVPKALRAPRAAAAEEAHDYTLQCALLDVDGVHSIAGLFCDSIEYIYDSNEILVRSDWTRGQYEAYCRRTVCSSVQATPILALYVLSKPKK